VAGVAPVALGGLWWRAWFPVDAVVATAVGGAGVALGDINFHFAWRAWHLATAWHLVTWTCTAGSGGAVGSGNHSYSYMPLPFVFQGVHNKFAWPQTLQMLPQASKATTLTATL